MNFRYIVFLTAFMSLAGLALPAQAAPGDLDASFGTGGITLTNFPTNKDDAATHILINSDGKIIASGISADADYDFAIARYTMDGVLDTTFGVSGFQTTKIGIGSVDIAASSAFQSDGKIIVAGYSNSGGNDDFAVVRYDTAGILDPSFGTGGVTKTPIGAGKDDAVSLAIQPDDKIVVSGLSVTPGMAEDWAIARYTKDGVLDATFGSGAGFIKTDFAGKSDIANSVIVLSDGKILAAGSAEFGTKANFALARYDAAGHPDASFAGGAGKLNTPIGAGDDFAVSVNVQSDGKIVVAGQTTAGPGDFDFAVVRYDASGNLDPSFGTGGIAKTSFSSGYDTMYSAKLQPDGQILTAGFIQATTNVIMARFNTDGTLDATFGSGGHVTTPVGSGPQAQALNMQLQPDGKIVLSGLAGNGSNLDFALMRFLNDAADLQVILTATPDSLSEATATPVSLSTVVTNAGPQSATGVTATVTLPAVFTLEAASITATQGSCSGTGPIVCTLGNLASGADATVTIGGSVTLAAGATADVSSSVTSLTPDPESSNNTVSVAVAISGSGKSGGGCSLLQTRF